MYEREITIPSKPSRPSGGKRRRRRRRPAGRLAGLLFALALCVAAGVFLFKGLAPAQAQNDGAGDVPPASSGDQPGTAPDSPLSGAEPEEPASGGVRPEEPALSQEPAPSQEGPDREDWRLILVNPWNALPEDYEITLKQLDNGHAVDERCYPDLQEMMDACRADGLSPLICSSYRTQEKQEYLYQNKINRLIAQGYSQEDAVAAAGAVVAVPGTSEHQLGLALDIVDVNNQNLDESQESTAVQQWLMEHCWEYGFILRYPNDKSEITGIIYEPWHYRYVGREAAEEIYSQGVCLEEYLGETEG